ncbi:hypothetical protein D3C72_1893420 [compost metagenome]
MQGRDDAVLALDSVGAFQQGPTRLAPQDIGLVRRVEAIGRVGLATVELADREGAANVGGVLLEPGRQALDRQVIALPDGA